jgi:plasmid replication initiation protein
LGFRPELKKHFTTYSLTEYLSLPSTYSQRIYEILRSWDDCVTTEISTADLHERLCTPPSLRKNFAAFRRRVLDKSHKDITGKTRLRYEWEPIKKGRKVTAVRFHMGKKTMAKTTAKKKQADQQKQSKKNNALFLAAVQCAADHPDGCGQLRGTHDFCKACMAAKKPVETELNLFDQESK